MRVLIVAAALAVVGAGALVWLCLTAGRPDPTPALTATATALLQPDAPLFTDAEITAIDELSDELVAGDVDAFLARLFPTVRRAIPDKEF